MIHHLQRLINLSPYEYPTNPSSPIHGVGGSGECELVEREVEPPVKLEPRLRNGATVRESQPLVQRNAGLVDGVDRPDHHVHLCERRPLHEAR
eukprot:3960562-Pyramimonas_sp.AAC.1